MMRVGTVITACDGLIAFNLVVRKTKMGNPIKAQTGKPVTKDRFAMVHSYAGDARAIKVDIAKQNALIF